MVTKTKRPLPTRKNRLALAAVCAAASFAGTLVAVADRGKPVLHEYVKPPKGGGSGVARIIDPSAADSNATGTRGGHPAAIRFGARILPRPRIDKKTSSEEKKYGLEAYGTAIDRSTSYSPDRTTTQDGQLQYNEVFNPSVVPFKRMTSLDKIGGDYTLGVHDAVRTTVHVGGRAAKEGDLFWGSMVIVLVSGEDIALPSVAPNMRILSYQTQPARKIVFSRDGADNFFVRTDDPDAAGPHRLVFLAEAPANYFSVQIPKDATIADATASGLVRPLPRRAKHVARSLFGDIGVSKRQSLEQALSTMVAYFRSYKEGNNPIDTGDIYRDLTLAKLGVCRHRSFAFAVTANVLGIPTRYVANEAHAFVEVWVPKHKWIRIDLGGAALELDVSNATGNAMHRPRQPDPFPKPESYTRNYSQLGNQVRGLNERQIREADRSEFGRSGTGRQRDMSSEQPGAPEPSSALPKIPKDGLRGKTTTTMMVSSVQRSGYRGETVLVRGRLHAQGAGLKNQPIRIYIAPAGNDGAGARVVARGVSGPDGHFAIQVRLPLDLVLGEYEVFASTSGDAHFAPSVSK